MATDGAPIRLQHKIVGDGEPVLLLHSVGLDLTWWEEVSAALRADFRVLRVDLRGHGRSPTRPGPWRMSDISEDVHVTLAELDLAPAHIVGQSFGGLVAQQLTIDHPEDVRSLVLSGTSATTSPEEREIFLGRARSAEQCGMEAVTQAALDRWFTPRMKGSALEERARRRLLSDDPQAWAKTFNAIAEHNTLEQLRGIRVPTLVTTGSSDVATPVHFSEAMAAAIPGAVLRVMDGAPHMGPFERPDLFVPLVASFLAEQRARPATG